MPRRRTTSNEKVKIKATVVHNTRLAVLLKDSETGKVTWMPRRCWADLGDGEHEVVASLLRWKTEQEMKERYPTTTDTPPEGERRPVRRRTRTRFSEKFRITELSPEKQVGSQSSIVNLALSENEPKSIIEIARSTGVPASRVRSHVNAMINRGYVEKVNGDWVPPNLPFHVDDQQRTQSSDTQTEIVWKERHDQKEQELNRKINDLQNEVNAADLKVQQAEREAEKAKKEARTSVKKIVIQRGKAKPVEIEGLVHEMFEKVVQLCEARMNVFLFGPTGCGKSYLCEQVAKALGLSFSFVSCTSGMSEGVLGGRLLPVGRAGTFEYVIAEFIKAYEEGGVFLLDEIDAADANVLLLINAALASDRVAVPNRPKKPYAVKHKDFVCIAAANTAGSGADRMYSGRNQLDAATLDRFQIGKIEMDYDLRVEERLCPDVELLNRLWKFREGINTHRLERAMSTRFIRDAYTMKHQHNWDDTQINDAFFTGWREDEVSKVKNYV